MARVLDFASGDRILCPVGEIDFLTVAAVFPPLTLRPGQHVVVDLSAVTFIDASGIGAIVTLSNELGSAGDALTVSGASPRQAAVFTLCGLSRLLSGPTSVGIVA